MVATINNGLVHVEYDCECDASGKRDPRCAWFTKGFNAKPRDVTPKKAPGKLWVLTRKEPKRDAFNTVVVRAADEHRARQIARSLGAMPFTDDMNEFLDPAKASIREVSAVGEEAWIVVC